MWQVEDQTVLRRHTQAHRLSRSLSPLLEPLPSGESEPAAESEGGALEK